MSNVLVQENVFEVEVTCGETVVVTMPGATGERGTIDIGTTSTVNPDQPAAVENVGTLNDAILNFDIPRGSHVSVGTTSPTTYSTDAPQISDSGANGDVVLDFTLPRAATVAVGDTDTVGPLSEASVINSGSNGDVVLNFEIPRGSLVSVGTTSTVEYGVPASVTNSGVDGDSILNFSIPSGPISKVTEIRGRTTLDSAVDTVAINISGFTETTDILYVFVNSIYVSQGQDYTVSGANIVRSSGTWAVGTVIDFVCLRSILIPIESLPETIGNTPIPDAGNYYPIDTINGAFQAIPAGDVNFDKLSFDTTAEEVVSAGQVAWNDVDKTYDFGLINGVTGQAFQEQFMYIKAASNITNGRAVMQVGSVGVSGSIIAAHADFTLYAPHLVIGVATQDILANEWGYITSFGRVRGINTSGSSVGETWVDGDILYVDNENGNLTNVLPVAPHPKIEIATVVKTHATVGTLFVRLLSRGFLDELHNVYIATPTSGQTLLYDSIEERWENKTLVPSDVGLNVAATVGALPIPDAGGYYSTDTIDGALQSVGSQLAQITSLDSTVGVKFLKSSSSPAGTRTYGAVGLVATAGVGAAGTSDFDRFSVYRLRLCNRSAGAVTAYFGEPGFSRSADVFVEIPKGYYRVWDDGTYLQYALSDKPFPYSKLHPAFMHNNLVQDYVYIGAYMSSYDGASKHETKSGMLPDNVISRTTARTRSKARGSYAILQDVQIRDWLNILMVVEFGTRDIQTAVGRGYCDMPYASTHDAVVAESAVNRIIIANAFADMYVVGQEISIGTAEGNNSIAADRTVTSIDVYDASNKAINFDGIAVNIAIGNNVWSSRQKNGKCDALGQGTGRASGTTGKTSVIYRGIENLWGNIWEWVDNLNVRNNQGYTDIEGRIASYNDTDFGTVYSALSVAFPTTNNYMVTPLIDTVSGLSCLPATVGGGSSSYYCDYYYPATGDRAARVGGDLAYGSSDGPWLWNLYNAASITHWSLGARLLEI